MDDLRCPCFPGSHGRDGHGGRLLLDDLVGLRKYQAEARRRGQRPGRFDRARSTVSGCHAPGRATKTWPALRLGCHLRHAGSAQSLAYGVSGDILNLSSRYEVLPQSFRNSFGAVANAELALRFFQVTPDCLLAKIQCLSNITG